MLLDIAPSEFLLIAAVAIVAIGPKDMPRALRTAGRWMGKMRRASNHLRSGLEAMIREAELEEMERKWREQNEAIMKAHPQASAELGAVDLPALPGAAPHTSVAPSEAPSEPASEPAHPPVSTAPEA